MHRFGTREFRLEKLKDKIASLSIGVALLKVGDFDEDKHPRDKDGKWTAGGGAGDTQVKEKPFSHPTVGPNAKAHEIVGASREAVQAEITRRMNDVSDKGGKSEFRDPVRTKDGKWMSRGYTDPK